MSNYTKTTDFEAKDSLPSGDNDKIIKGAEFETEFDAISTAIATKADTAGPTFTGTATFATTNATTVQIGGVAITSTAAELNTLDGITSTTAELNTLDGFTGTVDDLNYAKDLRASGVTGDEFDILDGLTATAAELNILDGATLSTAELNLLDGVTATTAELNILDGVTSTGIELNILDGVTATTAELNLLDGITATTTELNYVDGVTSSIQSQIDTKSPIASPTFTGTVTIPTADINGGAVDGVVIGGTTAAAGSFTTVSATGNITVDGTVDGRDVATDGTKLDGIEASATADQTDAEIRAAVEAATDSNVFTDADHTKLDGIETLADVTDTTNVTAAGALMDSELTDLTAVKSLDQGVATTDSPTFAGLTTTANVSFGDNDKAIFGAGSDLQIYHDGSNSFIADVGTGNLGIRAENLFLQNADGSANYATASLNGAFTLSYNNSIKLATTSTGIDVTGTATVDGLTVDGGSGNSLVNFTPSGTFSTVVDFSNASSDFQIVSFGSGSASANNFRIRDDGASRFNIAGNGDISFYEDTGTTAKLFWDASLESLGIGTTSLTPTDGANIELSSSTSSRFLLDNTGASGRKYAITSDTSGNLGFYDYDASAFRILVDSSGNVGIGTSSPATALEVNGTIGIGRIAGGYTFRETVGGGERASLKSNASNELLFNIGAASEAMRINSSGNVGIGRVSNSVVRLSVAGTDAGASNYAFEATNSSAATRFIVRNDGQSQFFKSDNSASMTVTNAGNVGIGTSSPDSALVVQGGQGTYAQIKDGTVTTLLQARGQDSIGVVGTLSNHGFGFFTNSTERMRIDSSGNVGIGVTPSASHYKCLEIGNAGSNITGRGAADTHFMSGLFWDGQSTQEYAVSSVAVGKYQITNGVHYWATAPAGTAGNTATVQTNMMLDVSGNLLVGTTSSPSSSNAGVRIGPSGASGYTFKIANTLTSTFANVMEFINGNGTVGSISTSASATTYSTSSDQRLKDNIVDAPSASDDIDAIQVRSFDWKADGSHQKYGMVAQELQSVAPEAVSEGETKEDMMGVDYSKLVPMMLKEIQSLRARVAQLEGEA